MAKKQFKVCKTVELKDIQADVKIHGVKGKDVIVVEYDSLSNGLSVFEEKDVLIVEQRDEKVPEIVIKVPVGTDIIAKGLMGKIFSTSWTGGKVDISAIGDSDVFVEDAKELSVAAIGNLDLQVGKFNGKMSLGLQGSFMVYMPMKESFIDDLTVMANGHGEIEIYSKIKDAQIFTFGADVILHSVEAIVKQRVKRGALITE